MAGSCDDDTTLSATYSSCSDVPSHQYCLLVHNYSSEDVLLKRSTGRTKYCNSLAKNHTAYFESNPGDCWAAVGAATGTIYVTQYCTIIRESTLTILDTPDKLPNYGNRNSHWLFWGLAGAVLTLISGILMKVMHDKTARATCISALGKGYCGNPSDVIQSPSLMLGILGLLIFSLLSLSLIGLWIFTAFILESNKGCHQRGPDAWTWSPFGRGKFYEWMCRYLGLCGCRNAVRERNCDIMDRDSNKRTFHYDKFRVVRAGKDDRYNCGCLETDDDKYYDCRTGSTSALPCAVCDSGNK